MMDTDWRPSPCPRCGRMRKAARFPKCTDQNCRIQQVHDLSAQIVNPVSAHVMAASLRMKIKPHDVAVSITVEEAREIIRLLER